MTTLGLGCAQLGNLRTPIDDQAARDIVEAAWGAGIRLFDTAPHYGLGLSERRLGAALSAHPRDAFRVSTKVGRLLTLREDGEARPDDHGFAVTTRLERRWDFSRDGVRRSIAESLGRLGVAFIDIALIHDPDDHLDQAVDEALPALHELKEQGVIGAVGVGSGSIRVLERFAEDADIDVALVAGRWSLLDQSAMPRVLGACLRRGIEVINGGVFNSGLLSTRSPASDASYDYAPAPRGVVERARRIAALCEDFGVSLPRAALAFAQGHPAVAALVVGADSPSQIEETARLAAAAPPPRELWEALADSGLIEPSRMPTEA